MTSPLAVMAAGTAIGVVALILIARELSRRLHASTGGKLIFGICLGMGVITIVVKTIGLLIIENNLPALHRESGVYPTSQVSMEWRTDSSLTAPWRALPRERDADDIPAKIALGRLLFSDRQLSKDGTVSCASCHKITQGGDDNRPTSLGIAGHRGTRNAPSVLSAALLSRQFWDGRAGSLEEQAHGPILNPLEMGMPSQLSVQNALKADARYPNLFRQAFGRNAEPTLDRAAEAIAAFERTLVADSRYDQFVRGDVSALNAREQRGMALFAGLGCRECHRDPAFSSAGLTQPAGVFKPFPVFATDPRLLRYRLLDDLGAAKPGSASGLWRAPSLRNVGDTSPYFHNGSVIHLREAIQIMMWAQLGKKQILPGAPPALQIPVWNTANRRMTFLRPNVIHDRDVDDISMFLKSLSSATTSARKR